MSTQKRITPGLFVGALILLVVALTGAAVFYGFMVYQSAPEEGKETQTPAMASELDPARLLPQTSPVPGEPVPRVILRNLQYAGQSDVRESDPEYTVMSNHYQMQDGRSVHTMTAWPPVWLETLAGTGMVPQLITGFTIGSLPAVYYSNGVQSMLIAREDPYIFAIHVEGEDGDGQTAYALGVMATIETEDPYTNRK
ncbi:MAG: hypothetical protein IJ088_12025 [Clostridia bacterium]|nr:hypothetical protein [Clostridia bacterium]